MDFFKLAQSHTVDILHTSIQLTKNINQKNIFAFLVNFGSENYQWRRIQFSNSGAQRNFFWEFNTTSKLTIRGIQVPWLMIFFKKIGWNLQDSSLGNVHETLSHLQEKFYRYWICLNSMCVFISAPQNCNKFQGRIKAFSSRT